MLSDWEVRVFPAILPNLIIFVFEANQYIITESVWSGLFRIRLEISHIYFWKCDSFFHFEIHRAAISRKLENALKYWTLWMWPFFSLCQQKICQNAMVWLPSYLILKKFLKNVDFSSTVAVMKHIDRQRCLTLTKSKM